MRKLYKNLSYLIFNFSILVISPIVMAGGGPHDGFDPEFKYAPIKSESRVSNTNNFISGVGKRCNTLLMEQIVDKLNTAQSVQNVEFVGESDVNYNANENISLVHNLIRGENRWAYGINKNGKQDSGLAFQVNVLQGGHQQQVTKEDFDQLLDKAISEIAISPNPVYLAKDNTVTYSSSNWPVAINYSDVTKQYFFKIKQDSKTITLSANSDHQVNSQMPEEIELDLDLYIACLDSEFTKNFNKEYFSISEENKNNLSCSSDIKKYSNEELQWMIQNSKLKFKKFKNPENDHHRSSEFNQSEQCLNATKSSSSQAAVSAIVFKREFFAEILENWNKIIKDGSHSEISVFINSLNERISSGVNFEFSLFDDLYFPEDIKLVAGYNRQNDHTFINLRGLSYSDWMIAFIHEILHNMDEQGKVSEQSFNELTNKNKKIIQEIISKKSQIKELNQDELQLIQTWVKAGIESDLNSEIRVWIRTVQIYREALKLNLISSSTRINNFIPMDIQDNNIPKWIESKLIRSSLDVLKSNTALPANSLLNSNLIKAVISIELTHRL